MCAPCSNATLERFFSQLRVIKSVWCNRLSEENLTHLLQIKVTGPSLEIFHNDYCNIAVDKWYRNRRLGQNKRKKYRKRKRNKKQRGEFELPPLLETSSESEESDNNI